MNIVIPVMTVYYASKAYDIKSNVDDYRQEDWDEYQRKLYISKYAIGFCQLISVVFMLWAIIKIYRISGQSMTIKQLVNQRIIITHVITMFIYLGSVIVHLIFYTRWQERDDIE